CTEADFLPRALYGEDLRERLRAAVERAPAGVHCTHIRGRVVRIVRTEDHARWQLVFEDGREMLSDQVVLALGNPPPARLSALRAILPTQHYIHNPWDDSARSWSAPRVLLVGTSLTMADVAMRLFHDRTPPQKIVCLSRHGYLPLEQTSFDRSATGPDAIAEIEAAGCSLRRVVHAVHALGEEAAARGADWRELVTIVRKRIPRLWGRLSDEDRRRFLRHVRPIWDKHRHRLPCETLGQIEHMRSAGILDVRAGSLVDARVTGEEVDVCWRPRGTSQVRSESFDRVINCTGPDYDAVRSDDPLVSCLLESGLISADRLSLGVRINERYEVIGAGG